MKKSQLKSTLLLALSLFALIGCQGNGENGVTTATAYHSQDDKNGSEVTPAPEPSSDNINQTDDIIDTNDINQTDDIIDTSDINQTDDIIDTNDINQTSDDNVTTNHAPIVTPQSIIVTEDSTTNLITLTGTDPDGNPLTYTVVTPPSHGSLSGTAPNLTYTPIANYNGTDSLSYTVSDGIEVSDVITISITVSSVNDTPTANAGADKNITYSQSVDLNGSGTDDGSIVAYEWTLDSNPDYHRYTQNVTPVKLAEGTHIFTLTVTDNDGDTNTDTIMVIVLHLPSTLKKTGQTDSYSDGDDGYYQYGLDHNYTRDNEKNIVTDHLTGLKWQDNAIGSVATWQQAIDRCEALTLGGLSNWRLPTRKELIYIAKYTTLNPALDDVFLNVGPSSYWSATPHIGDSARAWHVYFPNGYQGFYLKTVGYYVRCVTDTE